MKNWPTAVYLQDNDVFRLVMVKNETEYITAKLDKNIHRIVDEIGVLSRHNYPNLDKITLRGESSTIEVLRKEVHGISQEELSETLRAVLRLNFELLDNMDIPKSLFSSHDRAEMLKLGLRMIYSKQGDTLVETAYYTINTTVGWADFLTDCAMYYNLKSLTKEKGYASQGLCAPVEWVVKASNLEEAHVIYQWEQRLNRVERVHDVYVARLHEGEDRKNLGYNPLMAYVLVDDRPLTCFADWRTEPLFSGKVASDFDGMRTFIRVQKPPSYSGRTVGRFTLVTEKEVRMLFGM